MRECRSTDNYELLSIIRTWFKNWGTLLLIGVIMVPLCKHLHQLAGKVLGRVVAIGHFVVMVIMAILLVCYLGLQSSLPSIRANYRVLDTLSKVTSGLGATYNVVAFIGTCLASISILFAVIRSSQIQNSVCIPEPSTKHYFRVCCLPLYQLTIYHSGQRNGYSL